MKVSKCRKFGDLALKTVALVKFLEPENVWGFYVGRACTAPPPPPPQPRTMQTPVETPIQTPIHSLSELRGIFGFKNKTSLMSQFSVITNFHCSFHF